MCNSLLESASDLPCGHEFCAACIQSVAGANSTCPVCNVRFTVQDIQPARASRTKVNKVAFLCKYQYSGCDVKLPLLNITMHENDCKFNSSSCQFCGISIASHLLDAHLRNECSDFPVGCPNGCEEGRNLVRRRIEHHVANLCPLVMVRCKYSEQGCDYQDVRRRVLEHEADWASHCIRMMATMMQKQQEMVDRMTGQEARMNRLEQSMQEIQQQFSSAQELIQAQSTSIQCLDQGAVLQGGRVRFRIVARAVGLTFTARITPTPMSPALVSEAKMEEKKDDLDLSEMERSFTVRDGADNTYSAELEALYPRSFTLHLYLGAVPLKQSISFRVRSAAVVTPWASRQFRLARSESYVAGIYAGRIYCCQDKRFSSSHKNIDFWVEDAETGAVLWRNLFEGWYTIKVVVDEVSNLMFLVFHSEYNKFDRTEVWQIPDMVFLRVMPSNIEILAFDPVTSLLYGKHPDSKNQSGSMGLFRPNGEEVRLCDTPYWVVGNYALDARIRPVLNNESIRSWAVDLAKRRIYFLTQAENSWGLDVIEISSKYRSVCFRRRIEKDRFYGLLHWDGRQKFLCVAFADTLLICK
eukprot:TRINITY_DN3559_c0_g1_i6.p1 TRINITY_DN3559_c0_g1~~TRINITY_DN3559_c0_g1_i6.p1  ORF type:complete len:582 (-),score=61.09 TRINITY_DN3559_c0_g1_i6:36-1781(-)